MKPWPPLIERSREILESCGMYRHPSQARVCSVAWCERTAYHKRLCYRHGAELLLAMDTGDSPAWTY